MLGVSAGSSRVAAGGRSSQRWGQQLNAPHDCTFCMPGINLLFACRSLHLLATSSPCLPCTASSTVQEEMYSVVTIADDQATKGKGTVVVQDA